MALVLIVDDDASIRRFLGLTLQSSGHEAITAGNGREAIAAIEVRRPDVIVLDLLMPVMSGIEFARYARLQGWTIPTIVISAYSPDIRSPELSGTDFLGKPFDPDELVRRVELVHQGVAGE